MEVYQMNKEELIKSYEHKLEHCKKRLSESGSMKDNLSKHGGHTIGYYKGMIRVYEDIIDDLKEME